MIFSIDDFTIEESCFDDESEQKRRLELISTFPDDLKETMTKLVNQRGKGLIRYTIAQRENEVGEITFSLGNEKTPEIGIELKENYRGKGKGYCLLLDLMKRYSRTHSVEYFIYAARNDNIASQALAKKLGGIFESEYKPLEEFGLAFLTFHIPLRAIEEK